MASQNKNAHSIEIKASREEIFKEIVLWGEASWWPKKSLMQFIRKTDEPIQVGTLYQQKVKLPFALSWDTEVIEIIPDKKITRKYINSFLIGQESVEIKMQDSKNLVEYSLDYKIEDKFSLFLWNLIFKRLHDNNIRLILSSLKKHLENEV